MNEWLRLSENQVIWGKKAKGLVGDGIWRIIFKDTEIILGNNGKVKEFVILQWKIPKE